MTISTPSSVCLYVCQAVCLVVYLVVCVSVCESIYLKLRIGGLFLAASSKWLNLNIWLYNYEWTLVPSVYLSSWLSACSSVYVSCPSVCMNKGKIKRSFQKNEDPSDKNLGTKRKILNNFRNYALMLNKYHNMSVCLPVSYICPTVNLLPVSH